MKRSELKAGDKVAIVNRRGDNVGEIYLNKAGDPPRGGHYVSRVFWEAEVVDPDVRFKPFKRGEWGVANEPGVRVRLLTNCRHGNWDRYQPSPFGSADVLRVDGKGDEITIPAKLIVNKKSVNDRLRGRAEKRRNAEQEYERERSDARRAAVERLGAMVDGHVGFGQHGLITLTTDTAEEIIAALKGSK